MSDQIGVGARQRASYDRLVANSDGAFITERPVLFSPAAAAQDDANGKGAYFRWGALLIPLEYGGWLEESVAHTRSCYLGEWTSLAKLTISGPDALAFLSHVGMNDLSNFQNGQIKHHVQLDENGYVASEGVVLRIAETEFMYTAGAGEWTLWQFSQGNWDAEIKDVSPDRFIFGVQGPTSLSTMEAATGESLRDIEFNHSRESELSGIPVRILRTGISGELGYEIHGPADLANEVWLKLAEAGREFGLQQLGNRGQSVQHIEAGIATNGLDYVPASAITPGAPKLFRRGPVPGSFIPTGVQDYFRKPGELGWGPHGEIRQGDFIGRDALLRDRASGVPGRTLVGLVWNADDVKNVFATLFEEDLDVVEQMELPRRAGPAYDQALVDGRPAGISTGRAYSATLRKMISLCVIDAAHAAPGTRATVVWGRPGTSQREIRATVAALPFKPDRRRVDVTSL
jgi:vanillate/3-O-methylgallate O-demethylase